MRILIYGAGVIGSLYAALLADAGYDTSIYARGKRLEILKNDGLLYKKNQDLIKAKIKILEEVPDDDIYDFILPVSYTHLPISSATNFTGSPLIRQRLITSCFNSVGACLQCF